LPHQRDGPAPRQTAPSQQIDERAVVFLPPPKFLRKPPRTTTPSHRRSQRRPGPPTWRGFSVRLFCPPTSDGAHALYAFLKLAAQRYGLEVGSVKEISDPPPK
jgi:hypothetical protein